MATRKQTVKEKEVVIGNIVVENVSIPGMKGATGDNGKSAYEIAVNHGFQGTEAEWLASLKGNDNTDKIIELETKLNEFSQYEGQIGYLTPKVKVLYESDLIARITQLEQFKNDIKSIPSMNEKIGKLEASVMSLLMEKEIDRQIVLSNGIKVIENDDSVYIDISDVVKGKETNEELREILSRYKTIYVANTSKETKSFNLGYIVLTGVNLIILNPEVIDIMCFRNLHGMSQIIVKGVVGKYWNYLENQLVWDETINNYVGRMLEHEV